MINVDAALGHHLFDLTKVQRIGHVPAQKADTDSAVLLQRFRLCLIV